MNIVITTTRVPFLRGGAELLAEGLRDACCAAGHRAEIFSLPFNFDSVDLMQESIRSWSRLDMQRYCAAHVDRVIHLKFPCYYADTHQACLWLLHQHRAYYDLWDSPFGPNSRTKQEAANIREMVVEQDSRALERIENRFTISRRVSDRLKSFNNLNSTPLYHPPHGADRFYCNESLSYIFCISRLEHHKRQMLLVDAMAYVKSPIVAIIAGEGGYLDALKERITQLGLEGRVRLIGAVTQEELQAYYANCRAVFFSPFDEDYGYVTLEAMLSHKPVITCTDAGGPLEFVRHNQTGLVTEPEPEKIAQTIDLYASDLEIAHKHGVNGRDAYSDTIPSWQTVVETLLN